MYHIKDDKRMRASATLICEGLAEALEENPYASLSVTQVCAATGVARTTFYRLFDTLDDVLVYQFDQLFSDALDTHAARGKQEPFAQVIIEVAAATGHLLRQLLKAGGTTCYRRQRERGRKTSSTASGCAWTSATAACAPAFSRKWQLSW